MLMIRFQRIGKRKSPSYRLILSEKAKDTQGSNMENLGHYDPTQTPKLVSLKTDRILYWISKGAQPSASVNNLLINNGVITTKKQKSVSITQKRAKKLAAKKTKAE